jgi:hypothetical protein
MCNLTLSNFFHPSYIPDVAPSGFHVFTPLKHFLGGMHMGRDKEVKKVKDWFSGLAADFYIAGI